MEYNRFFIIIFTALKRTLIPRLGSLYIYIIVLLSAASDQMIPSFWPVSCLRFRFAPYTNTEFKIFEAPTSPLMTVYSGKRPNISTPRPKTGIFAVPPPFLEIGTWKFFQDRTLLVFFYLLPRNMKEIEKM